MHQYIALLRGINVSGQKKIIMADLRKILENTGLTSVQTYIQSGNILFQSTINNTAELENRIAHSIFENYNFHVPVFMMNSDKLKAALKLNPYKKEGDSLPKKMYFTFLSETPKSDNVKEFEQIEFPGEKVKLIGDVVFSFLPKPQPQTKLNNNLIEKKLKVRATTRNLNTIQILYEMGSMQLKKG